MTRSSEEAPSFGTSALAFPISPLQEYMRTPRGRRVAVHTPILRGRCGCSTCNRKRSWTPERRAGLSASLRQAYAAGTRVQTGEANRRHARCWTAEQDDTLRSLVGRHDLATIAARLSARFGIPRTEPAVKHRCVRLGLSRMAARPYSSSEVGRLFGISRETVRSRLVRPGYLTGSLRTGGPYGTRLFERAELERLVTEHPELIPPEQIRDDRLRALAVAAQRGRRLLDTAEVIRATGARQRELCAWYTHGLVPSGRKVRGGWLIEAGDVAVVRALVAAANERRRRRAEACENGHPWTAPKAAGRRCPICRAARGTPCRYVLRLVDRSSAVARVVGRVRMVA